MAWVGKNNLHPVLHFTYWITYISSQLLSQGLAIGGEQPQHLIDIDWIPDDQNIFTGVAEAYLSLPVS